jgi:serine/threonine-protein kinase
MLIGKTIQDYLVLEQVAKGTQGVVYKGEHLHSETPVAIKVLQPHLQRYPDLVERFEFEATALRECRHPQIVGFLDHWRDASGIFLVMQWVNGGTLKQHLQQHGAFTVPQAANWLRALAAGLSAVHARGIIHRDIKPENILLGDDGQTPIIIDFGIAKNLATSNTLPGTMLGSPAYLAPEQLRGDPQDPITPRTDGYALGVLLYEMLLGEHPYAGQPTNRMMFQLLREPFPPIRRWRPDLAPTLEAVLLKATALAPHQRYAEVVEFSQAFYQAANLT